MNKLWLCGITNLGNEQNLRELIEPILEYFDGLVWTFHDPTFNDDGNMDQGFKILLHNKKEGKIITAEWCQRHFNSMNQYLWQGPMKDGDYFVQIDTQERMSPEFCAKLRDICISMDEQNIGMISNFGKGLIYRYNEQLEFRGSPHWYAINLSGDKNAQAELEKDEFWNVRDNQREPMSFVDHYLKYYLYPAGSNSVLLGLDKNGNPAELFPPREERRLKFKKYLEDQNIINPTVDTVISFFATQNSNETVDDQLKDFINNEKILNDVWRYHILGDSDFKDDHDFSNIIKIE